MSKQWSSSEINYLKRFSSSKSLDELAQRFETDVETVRAKLSELKLSSKEGPAEASSYQDPLVLTFEEGLKAMYDERWDDAIKRFESILASSDLLDLAGRSQQYLEICRQRQSEAADANPDPFLNAVFHKNRGDFEHAMEVCRKEGGDGDERFLYLTASIHSLTGKVAEAAKVLEKAIDLNRENRVHAFHDPDFAELRKKQEYAHLFGLE